MAAAGTSWLTAANGASLARVAAIPVVLVLLALPADSARLLAGAVYAAAALTDALDGFLARRQATTSTLGSLLDLTADKLLVSAVLIDLVGRQLAPSWVAIMIVARELLVSGVRAFAAARGVAMPAGPLGKAKTALTHVAILAALLALPGAPALLAAAAGLTVISATPYLGAAVRLLADP
jgi:CDP-diacylglycerol--glycerol-3-phosphate 3-phosphatidyltransferase